MTRLQVYIILESLTNHMHCLISIVLYTPWMNWFMYWSILFKLEKKRSANSLNRAKVQGDIIEKQKKRERHAKKVREKAQHLSTGDDDESGTCSYDASVEMDVDSTYNTDQQTGKFWKDNLELLQVLHDWNDNGITLLLSTYVMWNTVSCTCIYVITSFSDLKNYLPCLR